MASAVNVKRLTPYLRRRILQLYQSGVNQVQIVSRPLHEDNVKVSRQTVNSAIGKQTEAAQTTHSGALVRIASVSDSNCTQTLCLGKK